MSDNTDIAPEAGQPEPDPAAIADETSEASESGEAEPVELEPDLNAVALAEIAGQLEALGLAPEGDYDIPQVANALLAEIPGLRQDLANAQHALEVAQRASASPSSVKGRKVGPLKTDPVEVGEAGRGEALLALVRAANVVEVAFSNGKTEITGLGAVRVEGDAWAATVVGLQLRLPELIVHGPAMGKSSYEVRGYGLFVDGVQLAWAGRGDPLEIRAGAQMNLAPDICF